MVGKWVVTVLRKPMFSALSCQNVSIGTVDSIRRSAPNKSLERCCIARSKRALNSAMAVADVTANTNAIKIRLNSPLLASRHKKRLANRTIIMTTLLYQPLGRFVFCSDDRSVMPNAHRVSLTPMLCLFFYSTQTVGLPLARQCYCLGYRSARLQIRC